MKSLATVTVASNQCLKGPGMTLSREEVVWAYRILLGRDPENETVIDVYRDFTSRDQVRWDLLASVEYRKKDQINLANLEHCFWWHSIRLNDSRVTPGRKTMDQMQSEQGVLFDAVDLRNKSFLDIGAWNGGFTVEASRRGATRLAALDHFTWNNARFRGRETFDFVMKSCGIEAEAFDVDLDQRALSLEHLGSFDVVLFSGVFYHLIDPIAVLREACALAKETIIVETHLDLAADPRALMRFYEDGFHGDQTNLWEPNRSLIEQLLRRFGFRHLSYSGGSSDMRGVFHARRN